MPRKTSRSDKQPAAIRDIVENADYIARATSLAAARRFIAATERTINQLSRMPGIGSLWDSDSPRLVELRFFPVTEFSNHLVFYRPMEGGIVILRVLHGARDIAAILDEEE